MGGSQRPIHQENVSRSIGISKGEEGVFWWGRYEYFLELYIILAIRLTFNFERISKIISKVTPNLTISYSNNDVI